MANAQKFTKASTGHMTAHFERRKVEVVNEAGDIVLEYVNFGNQDIDTSRSYLNYNLAPDHPEGQVGFIRRRCSEAHCMKRADVNVMVSWVVTLPTQDVNSEELTYTPEQQREYFAASYEMLADRYGRENVVSCYVHLDETTPHMHFAFVPVTPDRAWNKKHPDKPRDKVSAKEVLTRTDLQTFHPDLQQHLDTRCGQGLYPVLNGATEGGNRSILELKALRAAEQLADVEAQLWSAQMELQDVKVDLQRSQDALKTAGEALSAKLDEIQELEPRATALEDDVATLEARRENLRDAIAKNQEELEAVSQVLHERKAEARAEFGSADAARERIKKYREAREREKKLATLEAFVDQPAMRADWEAFQCLHDAKGKRRSGHEFGR